MENKIQVILTTYNSENTLLKCLSSIEATLKGYEWIIVVSDDGSKDSTVNIAEYYKRVSSADSVIIRSFEKAKNVAVAKNRALNLGRQYKSDYPWVCFMDADDEMLETRISSLLAAALKNDEKFIVGEWHSRYLDGRIELSNQKMLSDLKFGPWATLIHESITFKNDKFFTEELDVYEDLATWHVLLKNGINPFIVDIPVHIYNRHENSASNPIDPNVRNGNVEKFRQFVLNLERCNQ